MKSFTSHQIALVAASALALATISQAILVQPYNYMLDDSSMVSQHDQSGSLSPFYNDQSGSNEHNSDKDIVSIIGDSLARLRFARMLDHQQQQHNQEQGADNGQAADQYSQEMAELMGQAEKQKQAKQDDGAEQQSLSSSVANMILNVAQAAAAASANEAENQRDQQEQQQQQQQSAAAAASNERPQMSSRGNIMELDTSSGSNSASSMPSKADLKVGPTQWFNPKETIPVLKISSMATPSKYKKVYFRSEKKLVDGAFHSPTGDQDEKKSLVKPFNSGVQRRSSRGTSSSVPPSILQDGVIDFIKKFRDVYVQTRPVGTASGASSATGLASSMMAAAASSPFAAILAPSSSSGSSSRPSFASALSAATSMVNGAAMLSQAAANASPSAAASSGSSGSNSATGAALTSAAGAAASAAAGGNPSKSPLSTQTYVSFWSKTFPTWVRKMLKQMRRRSLYNSSKRNQHKQHQAAAAGIGQKIASSAVSSIVESASGSGSPSSSGSSSSSSSQSSGSSSSRR